MDAETRAYLDHLVESLVRHINASELRTAERFDRLDERIQRLE
jgi:hypothetical protein